MKDPRLDKLGDFLISIGTAISALAPAVLLIEFAEWVVYGEWPGWSVEDGLLFIGVDKPLARFDAVQFLLDIATDLPLAVGLYLGGLAIFLGAFKLTPEEA